MKKLIFSLLSIFTLTINGFAAEVVGCAFELGSKGAKYNCANFEIAEDGSYSLKNVLGSSYNNIGIYRNATPDKIIPTKNIDDLQLAIADFQKWSEKYKPKKGFLLLQAVSV
jgi:hypothetical protein